MTAGIPPTRLAAFRVAPVASVQVVDVEYAEAVVPNGRGPLEEQLGGPLYAPQRGNWSTAWIELLKSDGLPMYPSPDDPSQVGTACALVAISIPRPSLSKGIIIG